MGRIVIIDEEECGECHTFMGEASREIENFYADSSNGSAKVKRRKILSRCAKCQPIFEQKINDLKREGKVQVIPFGVSGQKKEERGTTLRDFIGRDKSKGKKRRATA